ncbi:MAG: hypothetical protein LBI67_12060 [Treponema sp.]|jgi:hypothetical protein|nr:hypothetical protein [Treponema sp.]
MRIDYERLHNILLREPLDYAKIRKVTGLPNSRISQVIDNLTFRYPLYQVRKGVFGLLKDKDDDEKSGKAGPFEKKTGEGDC